MNQLKEWQLWMYPYPTLVKEKRFSWKLIGKHELGEAKPPQMKRCVLSVASKDSKSDPRSALSRAFAICTSHLQKHGYVKDGSSEATKKGKSAGKSKAAQKGHSGKVAEYEKLLSKARGE